ncbi:MAG TPA: hypothetical protein VN047_08710 [Sphingopyxis sp.]|uniref:hypothetical protein n=1 Tax=Sphingopyxis sp. TaxID=1908224 RepID=UPI002BE272D9|nr:hypothetical protein [Sphingopyxis sp.]HWW56958.1 hypothetical protein [Sphingopyxis sp.]
MTRRILLLALTPALLAASEPGSDPLVNAAALPDEVLAMQRGGFAFQGMVIAFGADIRSFVNDELALRTIVSWTPEGSTIERFVSPALTAVDAAQIQGGILTSGGITMRVGDESVFLANNGQTALIQSTDAIQNVMINTASNVSLNQQVDAVLDISGYEGFRDALASTRMSDAIGAVMGAQTVGALGN